jgi:hypothetical protein
MGKIDTLRGIDSQRCDLWTVDLWPSSLERIAYEIKVSRADYVHELKHPEKRRLAMLISNRYCFAVPAGLIRHNEVPLDCGLVEVHPNGIREVVSAPWRDIPPPTARFIAELARRAIAPEQLRAAEVRRRVSMLEDTERRLKIEIGRQRAALSGALSTPGQVAAARALSHIDP